LVQTFDRRILNIHPARLPRYGGKGMYGMNVHKAVKDNGDKFSGITIHLVNEEFDKGMSLHSIPVKLGKKGGLLVSSILHFFTALFLIIAGIYGEFSWIYFTGTFVFLALLIYQHSIVSPTDLSRVNLAFGTTNGIASVVFSFFYLLEFLFSLRFNFI
jgi:hypothetical protein